MVCASALQPIACGSAPVQLDRQQPTFTPALWVGAGFASSAALDNSGDAQRESHQRDDQ